MVRRAQVEIAEIVRRYWEREIQWVATVREIYDVLAAQAADEKELAELPERVLVAALKHGIVKPRQEQQAPEQQAPSRRVIRSQWLADVPPVWIERRRDWFGAPRARQEEAPRACQEAEATISRAGVEVSVAWWNWWVALFAARRQVWLARWATGVRNKPTRFPKRAEWLKRELYARGWTAEDVRKWGGPDAKTVRKILQGTSVREDVLSRLAEALSSSPKFRPVRTEDIPTS
jgi:hypothetical protein